MKKWITAVALATLVATPIFAQEHGEHRRPMLSFTTVFAAQLSLTDAQKTQIDAIEKRSREDNATFFESARNLMEQVRAAREANDTAKLDALKPQMDANHEQMKKLHDASLAKIVAVLTADQRAKFEKIKAEHDAQKKDH
jgi:Spy/CpxP family protein refolding chaperone